MSKHKLLSLVAVFSLAVVASVTLLVNKTSAAPGPEEVARQRLPGILEIISHLGLEKYGFKDSREFASVTLGPAYEVYSLAPDQIRQYQAPDRLVPLLTQEQHLIFPVWVNNAPRGWLHVALQDGQWQVVQFGDLLLSQKLQKLTDSLGAQSPAASAQYSLKIVNVYPLHGVFALIEQNDRESIAPLDIYPGLLEFDELGPNPPAPIDGQPGPLEFDELGPNPPAPIDGQLGLLEFDELGPNPPAPIDGQPSPLEFDELGPRPAAPAVLLPQLLRALAEVSTLRNPVER